MLSSKYSKIYDRLLLLSSTYNVKHAAVNETVKFDVEILVRYSNLDLYERASVEETVCAMYL